MHYLSSFIVILLLSACTSTTLLGSKRTPSHTLQHTEHTSLARSYQQQINSHPGKSGFMLLGSGRDAFAARTALLDRAEKSIDVQYYIVRDDLTGHLFFQSLLKAANRGVRVRVLLDDLSQAKQTDYLVALDRHPNIEIRLFNPLQRGTPRLFQFMLRFEQLSRRMHNKSITIDNKITILGSRNIGNEYAEIASGLIFSGMEVLAVGPLANNVSAAFDQYWNYHKSINVRRVAKHHNVNTTDINNRFTNDPMAQQFSNLLKSSILVQQIQNNTLPLHWASASLIADPPKKIERPKRRSGEFLNATELQPYIQSTRNRLLIITPYLVLGQEGLTFFRQLRQRGIQVSILTNSYAATDIKIVHSHYDNYRKPLLEMGVELFEFKSVRASISLLQRARNIIALADRGGKAGLHAKIINFDQSSLYIGSMNIDPRSIYANTELGVVISSKEISGQVLNWFDQNLDQLAYHLALHNGKIVWRDFTGGAAGKILTEEPDTNPLDRILMHLIGLLPIEDQL